MHQRLQKAREDAGFAHASDAARALGIAEPTYLGHENGSRGFTKNVAKYARKFGVTADWLLTGRGEARRDAKPGGRAQRAGLVESFDPDAATIDDTPGRVRGILEIDVRAGMGGGGVATEEFRRDGDYSDPVKPEAWMFPSTFLRGELRTPAERLIVIETQGDSMVPTIGPGERLLVDTSHRVPSPDGIYALRDRYDFIVVKRLQVLQATPRVRIISDNQSHAVEEVGLEEIEIVGRVICGLKRY